MPNLIGSLNKDATLTGIISSPFTVTGTLSTPSTITGALSNATLRGIPVELQINNTMLQWKYLDEEEWRDLIDLQNIDYELLNNLPQIEGVELIGNKTFEDFGLTIISSAEIESILT